MLLMYSRTPLYCEKYVVGDIYLSTSELKVVFFMFCPVKDVVLHASLYCIFAYII